MQQISTLDAASVFANVVACSANDFAVATIKEMSYETQQKEKRQIYILSEAKTMTMSEYSENLSDDALKDIMGEKTSCVLPLKAKEMLDASF